MTRNPTPPAFFTVLLAATLLWAPGAPAESPLDAFYAEIRTIDVEHRLDGVVEAVNEATLTAEIGGRVDAVLFDVGDVVPADAVVIRLRGTEQKAELARAEAQVDDAEARLVEARENLKRIEALYASNAASKQALDQAKAGMEVAEASLDAANASLTKAREQVEYTVIRAPYGGVVTERHVERGESVSVGQPLMSGFLPDELRVSVDVPQRLIDKVRRHRSARVYLPGRELDPVEVTALSIFPYASEGSGTTRVRLVLPVGVESLSPGMLVKAAFTMGTREALAVPAGAVVFRSEVTGVYVLNERGDPALRRIRPGRLLPTGELEVLAGLQQGERIAADPAAAVLKLKRPEAQ